MTRPRAPRRTGGIAVGLVGLLVVGLVVVGTGAEPAVASDGACPDDRGVTVVVDFRDLGGTTLVRCAEQPVESGFEALRQATIAYDVVASSPSFLCRIEGEPAADPCRQVPPPDAYWSYWTAERGGDWQYNEIGAGSRTPPPGSVEGWSFSTGSDSRGSAPRTPPPPAPAPQPSESPTTATSPSPSPAPSSDPATAPSAPSTPSPAPPPPSSPAPPSSPTVDAEPSTTPVSEPSTTPAATRSPSPSPTTSEPTSVPPTAPSTSPSPSTDVALTTDAVDGGGSPLGPLLGLLLVGGVGGASAVAARRRR